MAANSSITYTLSYTEPFSGNRVEKCQDVNFSSAKKFQKSVSRIVENVEPGTYFVIKRALKISEPWYRFRKSPKKTSVYFGDLEFWVMDYLYTMDDLQKQAIEHGKTVNFYPSVMPLPQNPTVISRITEDKAFCNSLTQNHVIVDRNLCDLKTFDIPVKIVQFLERPYER